MRGARTIAAFVLVVTLVATDLSIARAAPEHRHRPTPARLETFELPTSLVDPSMPGGRLEHDRTAPKVHVLLPAGYDDHPHRRHPVLWLLHGANGGTDTWIPGITTLAAGLDAVVVMPDGGLLGMYTDWWNGGARRDPAWATYHLQVLRRTIEHRYRLRPERRWHTIAGISMGGQGALRYAAMLPGYFGSVVGFSAAVPDMQSFEAQLGIQLAAPAVDPRITYEGIFGPADGAYAEGNSPRALAANFADTRMYLTSGNGTNCPQDPKGPTFDLDTATELIINAQQGPFAAAARAAGADVTEVTTCGVHTFGVWDRAFRGRTDVGVLRAGARATSGVDLPHDRDHRRDVEPPVPLRRTAGHRGVVPPLGPLARCVGVRPRS